MLHHIIEYAKSHIKDSEPGFTQRSVHWLLHISQDGKYVNIEPYSERKKGKTPPVVKEERCPDMPNMRAGKDAKRAHFLVETTLAAALYVKDKSQLDDKAVRRNAYFQKLLHESAVTVPLLKKAAEFFSSAGETECLRKALGAKAARPDDWLMFQIDTFKPLKDEAVLNWWKSWLAKDIPAKKVPPKSNRTVTSNTSKANYQALDLLTGDFVEPQDRHPPLTGLKDVGGNPSGTPLICFDKRAFRSYGLKEGANACVSAITAQWYVDGLNHLLKASHKIAGARVAYWYSKDVPPEDDPLAYLNDIYPKHQVAAGALASAKELLKAIEEGKKPELVESQFFAMTLSGAAGRAMVRDWMEGNYRELAFNIKDWFSDMEIVSIAGKKTAPGQKLETIVTSLLAERRHDQKYSDWVKPIGSARRHLLHVAIQHQQISRLVVERLAAQLPAFLISDEVQEALFPKQNPSGKDSIGLTISRLYARMGLIKAYFIRLNSEGDKCMTSYLNSNHKHSAYHCGRLLAVFAHLQREALEDVGANVVQRFYTGFSQAPGLHLGRLTANAQNHLASVRKKDTDLAVCYENLIAEINGRLKDGDNIRILNLEEQGLFAIGYYQQIAQLRAESVCNIVIINQQGAQ